MSSLDSDFSFSRIRPDLPKLKPIIDVAAALSPISLTSSSDPFVPLSDLRHRQDVDAVGAAVLHADPRALRLGGAVGAAAQGRPRERRRPHEDGRPQKDHPHDSQRREDQQRGELVAQLFDGTCVLLINPFLCSS